MPESPIVLLVIAEIAVVLLLLCLFLLLHVRSLRQLIAALEEKVVSVRDTLKSTRKDYKAVQERLLESEQSPTLGYSDQIEAQIDATRNYHLSLDPDRDIVLDIEPDTTLERQAVALRHAFLIAEKEAALASDGGEIDWGILSSKLTQIITFYQQGSTAAAAQPLEPIDLDNLDDLTQPASDDGELETLRETLANQARHIENLEKFKKLFFDTEEKWRAATALANQYQQQLLARTQELGDTTVDELLTQYTSAYSNFGAELADDRGQARGASHVIEVGGEQLSVGQAVIANQEEMLRLRNMAIDQHRMIVSLRQQLDSAQSVEEKDAVIAELHKQLERHERFLKESDICAKQIEEELERTLARNHELEQQLRAVQEDVDSGTKQIQEELARTLVENQALEQQLIELRQQGGGLQASGEELEQLKKIIEDFTHQSCEMLGAIEQLEQESRNLREQLQGSGGASDEETAALQQQLAEAERELLSLQAQHVELEERYLELKVQQV
jgi:predicted  nucleic acid-binding Zn-ribbon protein